MLKNSLLVQKNQLEILLFYVTCVAVRVYLYELELSKTTDKYMDRTTFTDLNKIRNYLI